jgi:biopolymer transport protein ExbD
VLRAGPETNSAEVVKILNAVGAAQVSRIELQIAGQQPAGVSAGIRAKSETPYKEVVRALEALQVAGARAATLKSER